MSIVATGMLLIPRRAGLVLVLLAFLVACSRDDADSAQPDVAQGLPVTLVPADTREVERAIVVSGPVSPWEEMQLGVELSGVRVTRLNVDVGQAVAAGDVLLELDARTLDSELAQARAAASEADAGVLFAQSNLRRSEALVREQLVSAASVDELRAARTQAIARQATTRAMRDSAQLRRDFATLRAPAAGVISKRLVQPGQVVGAGTPLLYLIRDNRLEWRAELADSELARVAPGDIVSINSNGTRIDGRVRAVSPGVDAQTRTGTLYADLPDPGPLRAGSYVEGRITTGTARGITVPVASIVQRDGNTYVFTVQGTTARRVRVRTGANVGDRIEITDGVKPGTQVVERGAGFLGDGDAVRVVSAADAQARPQARPAVVP